VCRDRLITKQTFFKIGPIYKVVIAVTKLSHLVVEVASNQTGNLTRKLAGSSLVALNCSSPGVEFLGANFNGFWRGLSSYFTCIVTFTLGTRRDCFCLLLVGDNGIQRQSELVKAQVFGVTYRLLGRNTLKAAISRSFALHIAVVRRLGILRKSSRKHSQLESQCEQQRGV
jgi:hypothetical protein